MIPVIWLERLPIEPQTSACSTTVFNDAPLGHCHGGRLFASPEIDGQISVCVAAHGQSVVEIWRFRLLYAIHFLGSAAVGYQTSAAPLSTFQGPALLSSKHSKQQWPNTVFSNVLECCALTRRRFASKQGSIRRSCIFGMELGFAKSEQSHSHSQVHRNKYDEFPTIG
jgi:hypothetical protein